MSDDTATTPAAADAPVRSTQAVLVTLALILVVPVIAVLVAFAPRAGSSGAGTALVESVDTDKVQAIYLTNDVVYFGLVDEEAEGDFFVLRDAFFLRTAQAEGEDGDAAAAGLEPVPVSEEIGGDGDLRVNAREVLRVQALEKDSEIAGVIDVGDDG